MFQHRESNSNSLAYTNYRFRKFFLTLFLSSRCLPLVRNVKYPQLWIAAGSTLIIGASAYPVFFKETRPGHEIFSSEKPEVILIAQEKQREEYRRQIKEQRKQLQEEQETVKQKLQEQHS